MQTIQNDRSTGATVNLPEQQKSLAGTSAAPILPPKSAGNLRRQLFHLADVDRAALVQIRETLELDSNALAVRLAIRYLAKRLSDPKRLSNPENQKPAQGSDDGKE